MISLWSTVVQEKKKPSAFSEAAKDFIHYYYAQYRHSITSDPDRQPIPNWPKIMPLAMRAVKNYGLERLTRLLDTYLESDDPFYQKNYWSLDVFLSSAVLNKLNIQTR